MDAQLVSQLSVRYRVTIAIIIAAASTMLCYLLQDLSVYRQYFTHYAGDFFWPLQSARELLTGRDPYAHVYNKYSIPYPLTASLLALPLSWMPDQLAGAIFFGISSGLLAYGLTRDGIWRLAALLSFPYWQALSGMQWSPLMMAIALSPALLPLVLAKPNIGLPVALWVPWRWPRVIATIGFFFLSLLLYPTWPVRWLSETRSFGGFIPLLVFPGPLLLLALITWRNARARLLLAMALVPQQVYGYDQFLLWLIPQSLREMLLLSIVSWGFYLCANFYLNYSFGPILAVLFMYLPALMLIIWRRDQNQASSSAVRRAPAPATDQGDPVAQAGD